MICGALQPVGKVCMSELCQRGLLAPADATGMEVAQWKESSSSSSSYSSASIVSSSSSSSHASLSSSPFAGAVAETPQGSDGTAASGSHRREEDSAFDQSGRRILGKYFCNVCKLWDNSESKSIYHCPYCNVCRVGRGLGIDYRHCMACNCCVEMRKGAKHRCISQVLEGTCPICAEELRTSTTPLKGLPCGHTLHLSCYKQYRRYKYTCPVCLKSMDDMREYFGRLDQASAAMSSTGTHLQHLRSQLICNDCGEKSTVPYSLLYHKCPRDHCGSYNTRVLETITIQPII